LDSPFKNSEKSIHCGKKHTQHVKEKQSSNLTENRADKYNINCLRQGCRKFTAERKRFTKSMAIIYLRMERRVFHCGKNIYTTCQGTKVLKRDRKQG
jgi:hypothetical protein